MPTLTVIGGPNGAGKSSITASGLVTTPNLIDPDAIARAITTATPVQAAIAAGRQAILMERQFIDRGENFSFETTLAGSGPVATMREDQPWRHV